MATDLARARSHISRANANANTNPQNRSVKRPYQPTLAAYFQPRQVASLYPFSSSRSSTSPSSAYAPTTPESGASASGSAAAAIIAPPLAPLDGSIQASLLNVGMRVRKAVSGGYQFRDQYLNRYEKAASGGVTIGAQQGAVKTLESALDAGGKENRRKRRFFDEAEEEEGREGGEDYTRDARQGACSADAEGTMDVEMESGIERERERRICGFDALHREKRLEQWHAKDDARSLISSPRNQYQYPRKLAQPATKLWLRRRQVNLPVQQQQHSSAAETAISGRLGGGDVEADCDFGEASFLLPKLAVEVAAGDGAMDVD